MPRISTKFSSKLDDWKTGDKIPYCWAVYGTDEIEAVVSALKSGWLGGNGEITNKFEDKISALFDKQYGVFVNSGTSGLNLAFKALDLPDKSLVITPACTFSTTVAAITHNNLTPLFVDTEIGSYVPSPEQIREAVNSRTKAVLIPDLVGSIPDLKAYRDICDKYNMVLIEDSCDQIGGKLDGHSTGHFSDISVTSFYASHHITAGGGGGMICVDDEQLYRKILTLRDWGRLDLGINEDYEKRFDVQVDGVDYDNKFTYHRPAFNLKGVEMQAAFGLVQLKRLKKFNEIRGKVYRALYFFFRKYEHLFHLPKQLVSADVYWLAFPLTLKEDCGFTRKEIMSYLERANVQTRVLFAGNILRHPLAKELGHYEIKGDLYASDKIFHQSFLIGCHQGMTAPMVDHMRQLFDEFLKPYAKRT